MKAPMNRRTFTEALLLGLGAVAGGAGLWALRSEAAGGAFVPPARKR